MLGRYLSEIRTGCANERPSGSVRGATSNGCPYRDLKIPPPLGPLSRRVLGKTGALGKGRVSDPWSLANAVRKNQPYNSLPFPITWLQALHFRDERP
jgi:hypothetical protein